MAGLTVVDASVLIAFLDARDSHHERAIDALSTDSQFVSHPITLAEALVHPARLGVAQDAMARMTAIGLAPSGIVLDAVELAHVRSTTGLKMPDSVVVATARRLGAWILTFDDRLSTFA